MLTLVYIYIYHVQESVFFELRSTKGRTHICIRWLGAQDITLPSFMIREGPRAFDRNIAYADFANYVTSRFPFFSTFPDSMKALWFLGKVPQVKLHGLEFLDDNRLIRVAI